MLVYKISHDVTRGSVMNNYKGTTTCKVIIKCWDTFLKFVSKHYIINQCKILVQKN